MGRDLDEVLRSAEEPRMPPPEFERRLRGELLGGDSHAAEQLSPDRAIGDEPTKSSRSDVVVSMAERRRGTVILTVAAMALLIVAAVWMLGPRGGSSGVSGNDGGAGSTKDGGVSATGGSIDLDAARAACDAFSGATFAGSELDDVVSPANASTISAPEELLAASQELLGAFRTFRSALAAAGALPEPLDAEAERIDSDLRHAIRRVERGEPEEGLELLRRSGERLANLDALLRDEGVSNCW
jgi:hypothetical protein